MAVRKKWVDSLRFFAIMIVFLTHFITILYPEASRFWHEGLCAVILCGITGKLGVAMFSIILGYFAALAVTKENFDLSTYICKRYLRFFVVIAFTIVLIQVLIFVFASAELRNSAFIVKENFFIGKPLVSLGEILKVSLLFGEAIFPLLWCMDDFFFASLIIVVVFSNSSEKTYKIQGGVFAFGCLCLLLCRICMGRNLLHGSHSILFRAYI